MDCILVTGGAGFIGSNFVRLALSRTAARVVVVDKLTYAGSLENLRDLDGNGRFDFVRADIADRAALEMIFREHQPAAVVNLAAETHVDRSIDRPRPFVHSNLVGTFELLETSRRHLAAKARAEREPFRFLHVSTDEVYGSLGSEGRFEETTSYAPRSPYAASKAGADHFVGAYHATYGLPALITNCCNNYGPYQFPEKLIPLMIQRAAGGEDLPLYGDGRQVREWIHVEDHCAGILAVLERGRPGERYNIGSGEEHENLELVDRLCARLEDALPAARNPALARRGLRAYAQLKAFVEDRPGHDHRYAISSDKIRRELGWAPRHDLDSGLADTVRWYLEHRDWCAAVSGGYRQERLGLAAEA